tara:strand:+ start:151 stop:591 length:441 start_codon:yes stop_codon:yes gene_type:complete
MDGGQRHSFWRRSQEPNFNGGAADTAPGQNRASPWHGVWHVADIGIDAMMLAPVTQCILSMCSQLYAHMTITYHALVLPPGCSLLPANAGSSSSSILRAAGMRISIVLVAVTTPTSFLIAAAAAALQLLSSLHTPGARREHAAWMW